MFWYALAVQPRKEKATARSLQAKGYECFLPMYSIRRKWSDRVKNVECPLFTGYLFCRLDARLRLPLLKVPTVVSILGLGKEPEPIPDSEIEALQTVCRAGVRVVPHPFLNAGGKVRIREGPLAGVEGILLDAKQSTLILSITLLQRSVSVEIESEWVAPVRIYTTF
jgi:transcription antitermination factor NusG